MCLCAGLHGSLNRISGGDVKREDKEDDENCSLTDRSEDEKKDMKAHLGSRFLKPFFPRTAVILICQCMTLLVYLIQQ